MKHNFDYITKVIIGNAGVGKTNILLNQWVHHSLSAKEGYNVKEAFMNLYTNKNSKKFCQPRAFKMEMNIRLNLESKQNNLCCRCEIDLFLMSNFSTDCTEIY